MNAARALSVKETAEILGTTDTSLYRWINQGSCPVEPLRMGRRLAFPAAQVHFYAMFARNPESNDELVAFVRSMSDQPVAS